LGAKSPPSRRWVGAGCVADRVNPPLPTHFSQLRVGNWGRCSLSVTQSSRRCTSQPVLSDTTHLLPSPSREKKMYFRFTDGDLGGELDTLQHHPPNFDSLKHPAHLPVQPAKSCYAAGRVCLQPQLNSKSTASWKLDQQHKLLATVTSCRILRKLGMGPDKMEQISPQHQRCRLRGASQFQIVSRVFWASNEFSRASIDGQLRRISRFSKVSLQSEKKKSTSAAAAIRLPKTQTALSQTVSNPAMQCVERLDDSCMRSTFSSDHQRRGMAVQKQGANTAGYWTRILGGRSHIEA